MTQPFALVICLAALLCVVCWCVGGSVARRRACQDYAELGNAQAESYAAQLAILAELRTQTAVLGELINQEREKVVREKDAARLLKMRSVSTSQDGFVSVIGAAEPIWLGPLPPDRMPPPAA